MFFPILQGEVVDGNHDFPNKNEYVRLQVAYIPAFSMEKMVMSVKSTVFSAEFTSWSQTVGNICQAAGLVDLVNKSGKPVLIKPNLVENLAPPITTPVQVVEALVSFLQDEIDGVEILIGEGCGATNYDTHFVFGEMGYDAALIGRAMANAHTRSDVFSCG